MNFDEKLLKRFWVKVNKTLGGCWEWTACVNNRGYGQIRIDGKAILAHRVSFQIANRKITADEQVLHRCDNPKCVNPGHLFLGNPAINAQDKINKGRHARGESHGGSKLTSQIVQQIRKADGSQSDIARRFGLSQPAVSRIKRGLRWNHSF